MIHLFRRLFALKFDTPRIMVINGHIELKIVFISLKLAIFAHILSQKASLIQSKTVDDTIKAQIQRLIERTSLEIQNLESQLHDAHDIDYVEFTQTQALPAFEETATVFYLDLDDLLRRPTPYETR